MAKVNIGPASPIKIQGTSGFKMAPKIAVKASPKIAKKLVTKKVKAKLNTAAQKAFFPQPKYTVPKYPNA